MSLPKREVKEIVQLHLREGSALREVFVEGEDDRRILRSFLESRRVPNVAVLTIATVDVPDSEVLARGLNTGSKGRVVALAALLEGQVGQDQVVCIADADLDRFRGVTYQYSLLLLTDCTSIEMYLCRPSVMDRILTVALRDFPKTTEQVVAELAALLRESFLLRVALEDLRFAAKLPDEHSSYCASKRGGGMSFRTSDYVAKAMSTLPAPDGEQMQLVSARIEDRRQHLRGNIGVEAHGHDFVDTFSWYVRQHKGWGGINPNTLKGIILGFLDSASLAEEPLFQELLRRLGST
jgi:hypothetical protein